METAAFNKTDGKLSDANRSVADLDDNPLIEFSEPCAEPDVARPVLLNKSSSTKNNQYAQDLQMRIAAYVVAGAPFGIAEMLAKEDSGIDRRIFVLDNSGSTSEADGHVVSCKDDGSYQAYGATRWEEISAMAIDQARWNAQLGVRAEFYLLNPPCPADPKEGRDFVVIDPQKGDASLQFEILCQMLESTTPHGTTPLTQRLLELKQRLQKEGPSGRCIMLSIVTDGLPTAMYDSRSSERDRAEYVQELRSFASSFNIFMVIRLCTDDDSTVAYYNKVDEELELPLDILDDLQGESNEVYANGNGWFAYTPLIHRVREGGTMSKVFDLLDERPLKPVEIAMFLECLLRGPNDEPFPRSPKELFEVATNAVKRAPLVYNGRLRRMTPPVDLKLLKKALGRTTWARAKSVPAQMLRSLCSIVCSKPARR